MNCDLCESFFHPENMVDNQWNATSAKIFPHPETMVDNQ